MAKNKGKYHHGEKPEDVAAAAAAPPPDQFVTFWDRVGEKLKPHTRKLVAAGVAVAVLIGALSLWQWWDRRREGKASLALREAMATADAPILPEGQPLPELPPGMTPPVTYKSAKDRGEATLAALDKLDRSFGGSKVAKQARLVRAGVLYDLGRWDDAAAEYKKFLGSTSDPVLKLVAREGLGYALEAKALAQTDASARNAGLDAALAEYKQLQPDEKGLYRDMALYHQARVLQLKGDKAGAVALYKQIVDGMPGSQVASEARDRLAQLEQ